MTTAPLKFGRRITAPGYVATGAAHRYYIARGDDDRWWLTILRTVVISGVTLADPDARPYSATHDSKALAVATAREFEALGEDYRQSEHGGLARTTAAVAAAYDTARAADLAVHDAKTAANRAAAARTRP